MRALIDGDILRYEVGFGAETGWRAITEDPEALPPFDYVRDMLNQRIGFIRGATKSSFATVFLTEGKTFRDEIAFTKPYKGTRPEKKPWHHDNLSMYMKDILNAEVITEIEADDAMAIEHLSSEDETVICSRDKDLRQVPGLFYSWELGRQAEFGPVNIDKFGWIDYISNKIVGTGYKFFASQVLTGDPVDNIPGLYGCGPKGAYEALEELENPEVVEDKLIDMYKEKHPDDWEPLLTEQATLCWLCRRFNDEGHAVAWKMGVYE